VTAKIFDKVPKSTVPVYQTHHSHDPFFGATFYGEGPYHELGLPIEKGGRSFIPLVRKSFALKCALKIIFLRQEEPGRIYQGGDIDNRLKTLLDALSVPPHPEHVIGDDHLDGPIYCLMEDDELITGIDVETHTLLSRPGASKHEVGLIITVDVRVTHPRYYNQSFMGD
jgi:hypothetical protein